MMESLRGEADMIIETSQFTPHELRERVRESFSVGRPGEGLQVTLISFGYKYGVPRDADLVLDCRFLPNPYWIDELRPLPGTDEAVRKYVRGRSAYREFMKLLRALFEHIVPGYVAEGKAYLSVAIGCTGGRHRSVVAAEHLRSWFAKKGFPATVSHRDVDR